MRNIRSDPDSVKPVPENRNSNSSDNSGLSPAPTISEVKGTHSENTFRPEIFQQMAYSSLKLRIFHIAPETEQSDNGTALHSPERPSGNQCPGIHFQSNRSSLPAEHSFVPLTDKKKRRKAEHPFYNIFRSRSA